MCIHMYLAPTYHMGFRSNPPFHVTMIESRIVNLYRLGSFPK